METQNNKEALQGKLDYAKKHIDDNDFLPAIISLRQIAEHITKWILMDAGLWEEARTRKDGGKMKKVSLGRRINILYKHKKQLKGNFSKTISDFVTNAAEYGGDAAHENIINENQARMTYHLAVESVKAFLIKFPDASIYGTTPNNSTSNTTQKTKIDNSKDTNLLQKAELPATQKKKVLKPDNQNKTIKGTTPKVKKLQLTAGFLKAMIAKERLKTQEDYDAEL